MGSRIRVTLKQGSVLEGPELVAALKRLVAIGRKQRARRLAKEAHANGGGKDIPATGAPADRDRD